VPNHVTNVIQAPRHVLHSLLTEDGIDFGRVIPRPADDDPMFTATRTDYGNGMVGYSIDGFSPVDWAREHWGTKWNAYEQDIADQDGYLRFATAWTHPAPVIVALSRLHPTEPISVRYADEDIGHNVGEYVIQAGEITHRTVLPGGAPEAQEFAAQLVYGQTYAALSAEWDEL
jgi:hypothetical protein